MKKPLTLIITLVVIITGGIFFLRSGQSTDEAEPITYQITSSDGKAVLSIPESALPEGVTTADISFKNVEFDDLSFSPEGERESFIASYELLPDGLELGSSATVTFSYDTNDNFGLPVSFHYSEAKQTFEALNDFEAEIDTSAGQVKITGEVSHFSSIINVYSKTFMYFNGFESAEVGTPFPVHGTIDIFKNAVYEEYDGESISLWVYYEDRYNAEGIIHVDSGEVAPAQIRDVPKDGEYTAGVKYETEQMFTCTEEGEAKLSYRVFLARYLEKRWMADTMWGVLVKTFSSDEEHVYPFVYVMKHKVDCQPADEVEGTMETFVPPPLVIPAGVAQ